MITLDGSTYFVFQTNYANKPTKLASVERGLTGLPLRVESGQFQIEYDLTLLCDINDISTLRASFNKVLSNNDALDFIDEESVEWSPNAGTDDATHHYSTGVYFDPFQEPKPMTPKGWTLPNKFQVSIHLLTKAFYGLTFDSGYLLTEAGEYLITEAGDRLLWESSS